MVAKIGRRGAVCDLPPQGRRVAVVAADVDGPIVSSRTSRQRIQVDLRDAVRLSGDLAGVPAELIGALTSGRRFPGLLA
jgi:hypothetical protein